MLTADLSATGPQTEPTRPTARNADQSSLKIVRLDLFGSHPRGTCQRKSEYGPGGRSNPRSRDHDQVPSLPLVVGLRMSRCLI